MENHERIANKIAAEAFIAYGDADMMKSLRGISLAGGKFKSEQQKRFFFAKAKVDNGKLVSTFPLHFSEVIALVKKYMPPNAQGAFFNTNLVKKESDAIFEIKGGTFGAIYYFNNDGLVRAIQTKYEEVIAGHTYNQDVYKGGKFRQKYFQKIEGKDFKAINKKEFQ